MKDDLIPIGEIARRTGLAVSAIRYYEQRGLIVAERTSGNQRRFRRADIRRLSFIMIAQRLGLGLTEIEAELALLPKGRAPTVLDWQPVTRSLRRAIDLKIGLLNRARGKLDDCIGCGCLSLQKCQMVNRGDMAGAAGPGPRFVLG
ncbi:redox-sensitive transcriptional activator SoxR [Novosphingobium flavum]|uniref:Redox-sensitive transcriptional activator SoxR n=1 Tax=Novosphingobium flavum TaxID=1778672 RepID=A0A7X1FRX5_9SPHN|nr:redox-sensitive transcriptional activator SoxR [Novosphingobium flavum]MBC2665830.1 redox-sensitive transcriptional activator SoxR [Novosphingobium flavum]